MFRLTSCLFLLGLCGGCSVLSATPTPTVFVRAAPPSAKLDPPNHPSPGDGYLWVAGYWDYVDGQFVWRAGHWMPSRQEYEYVRASYQLDGKSWVFNRPYWRKRAPQLERPSSAQKADPRG